MAKVVKRPELSRALAEKCGFYKCNMLQVVNALEEIVFETLESATLEEDSHFQLMPGLIIVGHRVPEREAVDPRNGETIISPEKVIPRVIVRQSLRDKLYTVPRGYQKEKAEQEKKSKKKKG